MRDRAAPDLPVRQTLFDFARRRVKAPFVQLVEGDNHVELLARLLAHESQERLGDNGAHHVQPQFVPPLPLIVAGGSAFGGNGFATPCPRGLAQTRAQPSSAARISWPFWSFSSPCDRLYREHRTAASGDGDGASSRFRQA
jgi:hypothetical protein